MSPESKPHVDLHVRDCILSSEQVLDSKIPEFFVWIENNFQGTMVILEASPIDCKRPEITLHGPWKHWSPIWNGSSKYIRTSKSITFGSTTEGTYAFVTGHNLTLEGEAHLSGGTNSKKIKKARALNEEGQLIIDEEKSLLQYIGDFLSQPDVLNPNGEELDIKSLKNKIVELDSL